MRKEDAIAQLEGIEDQLDAEAKEDESARRQYGGRWPMAASYVANGELRDRIAGYRRGLGLCATPVRTVWTWSGTSIPEPCSMHARCCTLQDMRLLAAKLI